MRSVFALLLLCGCDQLFDLRTVHEGDPTGDGGGSGTVDSKCPEPGKGPPVFSPTLHEIISRNCVSYTISRQANRAVAECNDQDTIEEGPIDGVLSPATISVMPAGENTGRPALSPEGDMLYVKQQPTMGTSYSIVSYRRSGSQWVFEAQLAAGTNDLYVGAPSAGPNRRIMITSIGNGTYRELADNGGSWGEVRSGMWSEIHSGTYAAISPHLSVDGLRLVYVYDQVAYYADRLSLDMPFKNAAPIAGITNTYDVFMTPDCGRVYHNAAGSVVYRTLAQ